MAVNETVCKSWKIGSWWSGCLGMDSIPEVGRMGIDVDEEESTGLKNLPSTSGRHRTDLLQVYEGLFRKLIGPPSWHSIGLVLYKSAQDLL